MILTPKTIQPPQVWLITIFKILFNDNNYDYNWRQSINRVVSSHENICSINGTHPHLSSFILSFWNDVMTWLCCGSLAPFHPISYGTRFALIVPLIFGLVFTNTNIIWDELKDLHSTSF